MTNILDPVELTRIYKEANGELDGKARPLTTERIFAAMRAAYEAGRESNRKQVLLEAAKHFESLSFVEMDETGRVIVAYAEDELRRMAEGEK